MKNLVPIALVVLLAQGLFAKAKEYHVAPQGRDTNSGSASKPLKTISAAAKIAQGGDVITVHEGTYRERINPPRGGVSDTKRITYRAVKGKKVVIKGSEVITGWKKTRKGVWKVTLPNTFFGEYNPYKDLIKGDWFNPMGRIHHTGEVYLNGKALFEATSLKKLIAVTKMAWYCESDDKNTHIWASFQDSDPNKELVEINARPTCFYPDAPGRNFITVSGFIMRHAATQWAAPTAEQIGLIGVHWSKGWIIENNVVSDSKCVGITLGKDRASGHNRAQSGGGYNRVVKRALAGGWSKEKIGSHIVRGNTIHDCGAAGICGSMGGAFSQIIGNHIYNIHVNRAFLGDEMGAIKLHAPIDTLIRNNRIHDCFRAIWLDWMTQGTRVSANLCYNNRFEDLLVEVNHGPYVVDNNIFLSRISLSDWSHGGAFSHNLIAGIIRLRPGGSPTPYHKEHSTEIAGFSTSPAGDNRYYNNIFVGGRGLHVYKRAAFPMWVDGNVYLKGAAPYQGETNSLKLLEFNPNIKIVEKDGAVYLNFTFPQAITDQKNQLVTTKLLGNAKIPKLPYVNPDGTPLKIDSDYFGKKRNKQNPSAGPFENPGKGNIRLKLW